MFGRIIKNTITIKEGNSENLDKNITFRDALEQCLIDLCKQMDIQVPLWLKKNTTEFVNYRKTVFSAEQFIETISFDTFEIRVEVD